MKNVKLLPKLFRKVWAKSLLLTGLLTVVSTSCEEDNMQTHCLETCGVTIEEEFNVIVFSDVPDVSFLVLQLGDEKDTLISGGRPPAETNYIRCWQTSELRPDEMLKYTVIYEIDEVAKQSEVDASGIETNKVEIKISNDGVRLLDFMSNRCNLVPDAGPCEALIPKYYYDKDEKKCKQFSWGGCDGVVPFDTMAECEKKCDCK